MEQGYRSSPDLNDSVIRATLDALGGKAEELRVLVAEGAGLDAEGVRKLAVFLEAAAGLIHGSVPRQVPPAGRPRLRLV